MSWRLIFLTILICAATQIAVAQEDPAHQPADQQASKLDNEASLSSQQQNTDPASSGPFTFPVQEDQDLPPPSPLPVLQGALDQSRFDLNASATTLQGGVGQNRFNLNANSSLFQVGVNRSASPLISVQTIGKPGEKPREKPRYQANLQFLNPVMGRHPTFPLDAQLANRHPVLSAELRRFDLDLDFNARRPRPGLLLFPATPRFASLPERKLPAHIENLSLEPSADRHPIELRATRLEPPSDLSLSAQKPTIDVNLSPDKPPAGLALAPPKSTIDADLSPSKPRVAAGLQRTHARVDIDFAPAHSTRSQLDPFLPNQPPRIVSIEPHRPVATDLPSNTTQVVPELAPARPHIATDLFVPNPRPTASLSGPSRPIVTANLAPRPDVNVDMLSPNPGNQPELAEPRRRIASHFVPPKPKTDVQLELPPPHKDTPPLRAKRDVLAIFSHAPDTPELRAQAQPINHGSSQIVLSWDQWHARFADIAAPLLLDALNRHGAPGGASTVHITVSSNHVIQVKTTKKSNPDFDASIVEALNALQGNPNLEFPAGSHLRKKSFDISYSREASDTVSGVNSETIKGDQEIQTNKW